MHQTKHICTYFDFNFLHRGLALYHSIKRFHDNFIFYVLTFDGKTFNYLSDLKYENLVLISFETYNKHFNTNQEKYEDRKQYYFSATPNICLYILDHHPSIDLLLYLDADVFVFNSLDPLYNEVGDASIAFCPHRTHYIFKIFAKQHGKNNVGVNFFRNSEVARKCLLDWKSDCEGWYKGIPGYHLQYFSDQIFLDSWENKYPEIKIIQNIGVNTAPWNAVNYIFSKNNGSYCVDNIPLIIYHFSSLKKINEKRWNCNTIYYFSSVRGILLEIYKTYIKEIESFGIENKQVISIKLNRGFCKKVYYIFMRLFLKETLTITK